MEPLSLRAATKVVHCKDTLALLLCSSSEIPQFRLPYDVVSFEVELMKDLGVKVRLSSFIPI